MQDVHNAIYLKVLSNHKYKKLHKIRDKIMHVDYLHISFILQTFCHIL